MTDDQSWFAVSPGLGSVPAIAVRLTQPAPTGKTMTDIPAGLRYSPGHLWPGPAPA